MRCVYTFKCSVAILECSPERPVQFLLWRAARGNVNSEQKLFKVYRSVLVRIKRPEDMGTELLCIAARKTFAVNLYEHRRVQFPLWAVLHEAFEPLLYCILVISCVCLQKLNICFG